MVSELLSFRALAELIHYQSSQNLKTLISGRPTWSHVNGTVLKDDNFSYEFECDSYINICFVETKH